MINEYKVDAVIGEGFAIKVRIDTEKALPVVFDILREEGRRANRDVFTFGKKPDEYYSDFLKLLLRKLLILSISVPPDDIFPMLREEMYGVSVHDGTRGILILDQDTWYGLPKNEDIFIEKTAASDTRSIYEADLSLATKIMLLASQKGYTQSIMADSLGIPLEKFNHLIRGIVVDAELQAETARILGFDSWKAIRDFEV